LVGGGEDAGIEERGGFQRVFVREIRAEQNTAWLGLRGQALIIDI
jgi:hypothetical protein